MTDPTPLSISGEPVDEGHVGIAMRAMLFGTLAGTGVIALSMWGKRTLELSAPPTDVPVTDGLIFNLVLFGTIGGFMLTILLAWFFMRRLRSPFRRGGLSIVAGFATVLVMLLSIVADQLGGRWGLLAFAGLCAVGCLLLSRKVLSGVKG